MKNLGDQKGFTLLEVMVATAIFLLFAVGIYGTTSLVFKIVYQSRLKILETEVLSEKLEIVRNLPFESVGILNGIPIGLLQHTETVIRNGVFINLTTVVRNVDDPFDGTVGGSPNDTAPADYKLVEIAAICANCTQLDPVVLSTFVAPKNLEGASKNGALFINVFDANGLSIVGANVHIVNTAQTPNLVIDDVTNNNGMLNIVDAPTGTLSYNITVSKNGYSSESTIISSPQNPNPLKPPSNVVSQAVTNISFSIDKLGSLNVSSINPSCVSLAGPTANLNGTKVLGVNPNVYKVAQNFSLASGNYNFDSLEWDTYDINVSGTAYDLAGSMPMIPFKLNPGATQNMSLILKPHTTNSLLVKIKDAGTGLPLSDAVVHLTATGYDESLQTGLGYVRQTDWSGGSGQSAFVNESKYFLDDSNLSGLSSVGDLKLKKSGNYYAISGYLESSTFDMGSGVTFQNIIWEPIAQRAQTGSNSIMFQIAANNSSSPTVWNFLGPNGVSSTYYTATNTVIFSGLNGNRYLRYRVFLSTANNRYTPQLSEVAFTYTNNCTPPGQAFFGGLAATTYTLNVSRDGYTTNNDSVDVSGSTDMEVNMSPL